MLDIFYSFLCFGYFNAAQATGQHRREKLRAPTQIRVFMYSNFVAHALNNCSGPAVAPLIEKSKMVVSGTIPLRWARVQIPYGAFFQAYSI